VTVECSSSGRSSWTAWLASAIYALIALGFVVVYKASGAINFALGEWALLGSRDGRDRGSRAGARAGRRHGRGRRRHGSRVAFAFNHLVLRPMAGGP